jgi:hypothetical protein
MTPEQTDMLAHVEELAKVREVTTQGMWHADRNAVILIARAPDGIGHISTYNAHLTCDEQYANALFIDMAHSLDLPALIALVREQEAKIERLENQLNDYREMLSHPIEIGFEDDTDG